MNHSSIIPFYKKCKLCCRILFNPVLNDDQIYFYCTFCGDYTKWTNKTILHYNKISYSILEKIIIHYIRNKSVQDTIELLKDNFSTRLLTKNTVVRYFNVFNKIAIDYYNKKLNSTLLEGSVEIDETFLFKMKKSTAKQRPYTKSLWLFGMFERESRQFIIIPVFSRSETNLLSIILKYIKVGAKIYSDCFSTYVNNKVFPKESKLEGYGYHHQWINHKVEFVSKLFKHIHTNNIERLWLTIKTDFRKKNIKKVTLKHIARFVFHQTLEEKERLNVIGCGLKERLQK